MAQAPHIPSSTQSDLVLVVDDSPDSLSLIHDALEAAGIDVLVALEGKQALNIARKMKPDMILMDAIMPNMDGFETCRLIKSEPELTAIPVIFMTGLTDTADIVRGLEAGGVDYLTKPVSPAELVARIRVHLKNARVAQVAEQALDSTGQTLLTLNRLGHISWATPQSYALLARTGLDDSALSQQLTPHILSWLTDIDRDNSLECSLQHLPYPLSLKFKSWQDNGHALVKLVDGKLPTGEECLKAELGLTERESQVLFWIANGKTNREAAEILSMSPRTVNKHLEQIFVKLGVENRTAAAGIALRILAVE